MICLLEGGYSVRPCAGFCLLIGPFWEGPENRGKRKIHMENKTSTTSPFFNGAAALARYLSVDPVTVRRLVRRKALPFIRLGGRYLFRRDEIEAYLTRHTVPALGMGRTRKAFVEE